MFPFLHRHSEDGHTSRVTPWPSGDWLPQWPRFPTLSSLTPFSTRLCTLCSTSLMQTLLGTCFSQWELAWSPGFEVRACFFSLTHSLPYRENKTGVSSWRTRLEWNRELGLLGETVGSSPSLQPAPRLTSKPRGTCLQTTGSGASAWDCFFKALSLGMDCYTAITN